MIVELTLGLIALLFFLLISLGPDKRTRECAKNLPGPPSLPIIGNLLSAPISGRESLNRKKELLETYGPIVRYWLGPTLVVMLSKAEDIEVVLSSTELIEKHGLYRFLYPWLGTGLLTSTGSKWVMRRKAITPTFHFKVLEQFISVFNRCGTVLVDCLEKESGKGDFDIYPYVNRYTLDVICETAMGTRMNSQTDMNCTYLKAIRSICEILAERMNKPWLYNNFLYALSGNLKKEREVLEILDRKAAEVIQEKSNFTDTSKGEPNDENDMGIKRKTAFLELLLKMKSENNEAFRTYEDIREEVNTFMFEGHDTTTAGISFCLSSLAKNPEVQEKAYQEILENIDPSEEDITADNFNKLKYLERVIKESLRLYPPVPLVGRIATKDVKLPSGYSIPKGALFGINLYFTQRSERYYEDPLRFNPDNFLPEVTAKRHPYAYIPFSAGPRNCIGQKFAMLELKSVLTKILLAYKLSEADSGGDVVPDPKLVLTSASGHKLKITKR